ncbi:MAG TPA: hypothetical protein VHJ77_08645 [Vicinamibacterales bacterium]|nr:hypothetical protein [Vicinamibacterales bacterium]
MLAAASSSNAQDTAAAAPASMASLTSEELVALGQEQQDALILRAITNGINRYSSPQERNGRPKPHAIYQDERALANLLRVLFLPDEAPGGGDTPPGWAPLRKALQDAADREDRTPFLRVLSGSATATYERYKRQVTPIQSDQEQQTKFRYVVAFDSYQDASFGYKAAYADLLSPLADVETAAKTVKTRLSIERLAQDERGMKSERSAVEQTRIEGTMKEFIIAWNAVVKHHLDAALSPVDAAGRTKPLGAVGEEKRRALVIREISSTFDADEVARRIRHAMKAPSFAGLQPILNTYLLDEISRRLGAIR